MPLQLECPSQPRPGKKVKALICDRPTTRSTHSRQRKDHLSPPRYEFLLDRTNENPTTTIFSSPEKNNCRGSRHRHIFQVASQIGSVIVYRDGGSSRQDTSRAYRAARSAECYPATSLWITILAGLFFLCAVTSALHRRSVIVSDPERREPLEVQRARLPISRINAVQPA